MVEAGEQLTPKNLVNLIQQFTQFLEDNLGSGSTSEYTRIPVSYLNLVFFSDSSTLEPKQGIIAVNNHLFSSRLVTSIKLKH